MFLAHPELVRILVDLFCARLDPAAPMTAGSAQSDDSELGPSARLRTNYLERLAEVDAIVDDRIARAVLSMTATVRTNYFLPPAESRAYITLKFESKKILGLPDLAPLYEIHVNSPRMEGCHLRDGRVARGEGASATVP